VYFNKDQSINQHPKVPNAADLHRTVWASIKGNFVAPRGFVPSAWVLCIVISPKNMPLPPLDVYSHYVWLL